MCHFSAEFKSSRQISGRVYSMTLMIKIHRQALSFIYWMFILKSWMLCIGISLWEGSRPVFITSLQSQTRKCALEDQSSFLPMFLKHSFVVEVTSPRDYPGFISAVA